MAPDSSAVTDRSLSVPCARPFRSRCSPMIRFLPTDRLNDTAGVLCLT
ncbi:hypothetical protein GZL_03744 [Streptomyces sp. 769]|nr:hypothetical protein GZL_03744 [Streptomyces sp. 769]